MQNITMCYHSELGTVLLIGNIVNTADMKQPLELILRALNFFWWFNIIVVTNSWQWGTWGYFSLC